MTSEGHPYARFRRALERRSVANAWAAASELGHVSLADALSLCLLLRDREPARYPRAAVRWLGRYCCEQTDVALDEATVVAAHLAAFTADDPRPTAQSLTTLLDAHGRRDIATAVRRWYVDTAAGR
jgi:hypothetical protein